MAPNTDGAADDARGALSHVRTQRLWVCVALEIGPDGHLVAVRGDVDVVGARALIAALSPLVDAGAVLRCEMSAVAFFGAAGARAFARIADDLEIRGGRLTVEEPSRSVRRVLELAGLAWLLVPSSGRCANRASAEKD